MKPTIKINLNEIITGDRPVCIELGCGPKQKQGRICIDKINLPGVDIIADLEQGLPFLPDACVDEIHCTSFLEHIDNFELLVREIVRVLKPEGRAHVFVPHFSNPYFYSDPTHKRYFGLYSFYYFVETERQLKRKVPNFYTDIRINIISLKLIFKSPFWFRRQIKKLAGFVFNCHPWLQEFYEENLCYLVSCYGINLVFSPALKPTDSKLSPTCR
jgi:SAM-dependent methyltransferase